MNKIDSFVLTIDVDETLQKAKNLIKLASIGINDSSLEQIYYHWDVIKESILGNTAYIDRWDNKNNLYDYERHAKTMYEIKKCVVNNLDFIRTIFSFDDTSAIRIVNEYDVITIIAFVDNITSKKVGYYMHYYVENVVNTINDFDFNVLSSKSLCVKNEKTILEITRDEFNANFKRTLNTI